MAAMQMNFGLKVFRDGIDGRQRVGKMSIGIPLATKPLVMNLLARGQSAVTKIGQRRVVDLHDVNSHID